MYRSILKYCFSALAVLLSLATSAKQEATGNDSTREQKSRERLSSSQIKDKYLPTGLRIGTDLITGIKGYRNTTFNGWELNADVDFNRYYLAIDYGRWAQGAHLPNGWYDNDGKYFRLGVDVNLLKKDPDRNMFFMGLRYARSSFGDSVSYSFEANNYGVVQKNIVNKNLTASWAEITSGLRVKLWKYFWMGYTIRLKFAPQVRGNQELQPFDIPGYGVFARKAYWGFNYQIFFKIPVRKEPKVEGAKGN
jgi:Domain of unknown function (DUF6048)